MTDETKTDLIPSKVITFRVVGEYPMIIDKHVVEPGGTLRWRVREDELRPEWDGTEYEVSLAAPEEAGCEYRDPHRLLEWAHRRPV